MNFDDAHKAIQIELNKPQADYASAKDQAKILDDLLGYQCSEIEKVLFKDQNNFHFSAPRQFWYGLDLQSLQTPYSEIVEMIQLLDPQDGERWLDLGAAYGRMGVVLGFLRPDVGFIGYEFVEERVNEGRRILKKWCLSRSQMKKADIASADFEIEEADLYFIYDFGSKADIYQVLEKLRRVAAKKSIRVIARGRGIKNWILMDFPWLSAINSPEHFSNWSLFRS